MKTDNQSRHPFYRNLNPKFPSIYILFSLEVEQCPSLVDIANSNEDFHDAKTFSCSGAIVPSKIRCRAIDACNVVDQYQLRRYWSTKKTDCVKGENIMYKTCFLQLVEHVTKHNNVDCTIDPMFSPSHRPFPRQ